MKNVRPPQLLENLYRDMRDRRLLIPAAVLVVALVAVPVLLHSHSSQNIPSVTPVGGAGKSDAAAVPAVVTQQVGVTEYRKRLNQLNSKNPFHQQYTAVPKAGQAHASATAAGSSTSTVSGTTGVSTTTTKTSTTAATTPLSPTTSPPSGGVSVPANASTPPPQTSTPPPTPKPTLYAARVSIAIGEPGDLTRRDNVQLGVILPSENKPMTSFIGTTEDLQTANFVLANTVDEVKGGQCVPNPNSCSLLQLKQGQEAHLHYAPQNRRYNLKLIGVRLVPVHKLPGKTSSPSQKGPQKTSAASGVAGLSSQVVYGRSK
jgi:hypothetical protein